MDQTALDERAADSVDSARSGSAPEQFDPQPDAGTASPWWSSAVIYQIYVRSFADGNGDGTGDLVGVADRLPYLAALGVDALWFTPWYPSPLADGGYDIADYRAIDPRFGTLGDAEELIRAAAALGIRTIIDVVPNHISSAHVWFQEALAAPAGSPARQRFWFHDGAPDGGPPNGWVSEFAGSGSAWSRVDEPDGTPGQWYLHLFTPQQPDLNWEHPDVAAEHEDILRFWFDRGVAGVRIDSAALLVKDPALPEVPDLPEPGGHPHHDRDRLHEIYRGWRRIADSYPDPRILVGEVWLPDPERFGQYLRPDELHTAFNFDFMSRPWDVDQLRASIANTLAVHARVGATATWVLSNHDVTRPATRYGRADSSFAFATKGAVSGTPSDLALGQRRARAAALLALALPGSAYIYQGDELGLPEVEDIPPARRQDPMYVRSGGADPGRDGCRVPIPWTGTAPPYGFSPSDSSAEPWLPQPSGWADLTVGAQVGDPASTLWLYRNAVHRRREVFAADSPLVWMDEQPPAVLGFRRGSAACLVNFGDDPAPLPADAELVLSSTTLVDGLLPADAAAWIRLPEPG